MGEICKFLASILVSDATMSRHKHGPGEHFRPTIFKLMATEDKLTAASGLATIMEVFDESPLSSGFKWGMAGGSDLNHKKPLLHTPNER